MSAFKYASLKSTKSIRLLVLRPSLFQRKPISCYLRNVELSKLPKYEALSYTWDGQEPSVPIKCGDSELIVTKNVDHAINHLRRRFSQRTLWIDAICIDQHNAGERGSQVSFMDEIYRNASQVLIWLGNGDDKSSQTVRALKYVFPVWKSLLNIPFTRYFALRRFKRLKLELQDVLTQDHNATSSRTTSSDSVDSIIGNTSKASLRRIVNHDWFRRIWTIQEVSMAKKATIVIGNSTISWKSLSNTLSFDGVFSSPSISPVILNEGGYNPAIPVYNGSTFIYRVQQIQIFRESLGRTLGFSSWIPCLSKSPQRPSMSFIFNLLMTGLNPYYHVTNSRDRVYGIQGLIQACGVELPTADYSLPIPEILARTIQHIAIKHNSLDFLELVNGESTFRHLRSWIPDFDAVPWSTGNGNSSPRSDETELSRMQFTDRGLKVSGSILGSIKYQSPSFSTEATMENHPYHALSMSSKFFLDGILRWTRFVEDSTPNLDRDTITRLLFHLFLHPQVLPLYESLGFQIYDRPMSPSDDRFEGHRLYEHFSAWLKAVRSSNDIVTCSSDHIFDQVQHFVSSEWINTTASVNNKEHTIGYQRAMLVIQRWVREFVARKRLFKTDAGSIGITWRAARINDVIVNIDGVRSPVLLRGIDGLDEYQIIGPCLIPQIQKKSMVVGYETKRPLILV